MHWRSAGPPRGAPDLLDGVLQVQLVLNVVNWLGRPAHVYMRLPAGPGVPVRAQWSTGGQLLPGSLITGGERALLYAGVIQRGQLTDQLTITLTADGRRLTRPQQLDFVCEIEVS